MVASPLTHSDPEPPPPPVRGFVPTSEDALMDDGFELLDGSPSTQKLQATIPEEMWWYACAEDTTPRGPISEFELRELVATGHIRQDDSVWRKGLLHWESVATHFSRTAFASPLEELTPVQHILVWRQIRGLATLAGEWEPPPQLVRQIARGFWLGGLLILAGSLMLFLFGWSCFSLGFQLLLIAAVLELTAAMLQRKHDNLPPAVEPSRTSQESAP